MKIMLYAFLFILFCVLIIYFLVMRKKKKLFKLAYSLGFDGQYIEAIKIYDYLIMHYPKNYIFYNNRGYVYLLLKDVQNARFDFEKSILLEPDLLDNHMAYSNMERLESFIKNGDF